MGQFSVKISASPGSVLGATQQPTCPTTLSPSVTSASLPDVSEGAARAASSFSFLIAEGARHGVGQAHPKPRAC